MRSPHPSFALPILLLAGSTALMAQGGREGGRPEVSGTLRGVVLSSDKGELLGRASVALRRQRDSTLVTGAIAGADGRFSIGSVPPGRYYLRVTYVGFAPRTISGIEISASSREVDLGRILLDAGGSSAADVLVTAEREGLTVATDRLVYRTDEMLVASGGDATDLLKNIPSVEVDVNGNISLRGNQNVVVQLNGRPTVMTGDALAAFLQNLPADAIDRVEVIANPSAKYDPEGMGGIINVELKRGEEIGLGGGVNASVGSNGSWSAGASLSYGSGPINFFATYGFSDRSRGMDGYREQIARLGEPYESFRAYDTSDGGRPGHTVNTAIEYAPSREHAISASVTASLHDGQTDRITDYTYLDPLGNPVSRYARVVDDSRVGRDMDYRLGYRWSPDPRNHTLAFEARYETEDDDETDVAMRRDLSIQGETLGEVPIERVGEDEQERELSFQADYLRPLWEGGKLEAGYKGSRSLNDESSTLERFDATAGEYLLDPTGGNAFEYDETIHALYAIIGHESGPFGIQGGVRGEYAQTLFTLEGIDSSYDRSYTSLFPSAHLSYRPTEELQIRGSYSLRVNRPRTRQLNPIPWSTDPQIRRVGNPWLDPEYTHSIEIGATQFTPWGSLTLTPYFRRTVDAIEHFERLDTNGVVTLTFENLGQVDSYGAELIGSAKGGDWLTLLGNVGLFKTVTDAGNIEDGLAAEAFAVTARLTASAKLIDGLDLQGSVFYRSPSESVNGTTDARVGSDLAIQSSLLENRLRLGLRFQDLFSRPGFGYTRETPEYLIEVERNWHPPIATLTLSYQFGESVKKKRGRDGREGGGEEDMDW